MNNNLSNEVRFSRDLSLWQAMARGLGVMLMASAFVLLSDATRLGGALTPVIFLLAGLLLVINLLGYAELTTRARRPGNAYRQVYVAEGGWLAFLTGWTLLLSGLALCALLAQGFGVHVTTLLHDHLNMQIPAWPWAMALVVLLAINNALGTRGGRQGLITVLGLLLAVLLGIILLATPQIRLDRFASLDWMGTEALTVLLGAAVGLEITTSLLGETEGKRHQAFRGLLLPLLLAAGSGALIATATVGVVKPDRLAQSRVPLALLGGQVAGGGGRPLVLIVGGLALALAFNSTLILVVRQFYLMSKHGYWPKALHQTHDRFGTPIWSVVLVALLLIPLSGIPSDVLGHVGGLLYLLMLMFVNLTLVRRPEANDDVPFRLPFHPWVPGLALVVDLLVILWWEPLPFIIGAGALIAGGVLYYVAHARRRWREAQEEITVFKPSAQEAGKGPYRVLVPIANPATAGTLLRLGGVLARQYEGVVIVLQVVLVPDQVPLEEGHRRAAAKRALLERAVEQAREEGFAIQTITRVAHSVADGILDTAREESADLILMGWRGYTRSFGTSMGPIIDPVVRRASCDVTVAKGEDWRGARKILVPTAGGPHAPIAARLAMMLSHAYGSEVTALHVQLGRATPQQMEENRQRIAETLEGLDFPQPPEQKVIVAESVVEGIVREAEDYDLVLLGASEEGLFDQFVFGSIPQQIAARVPKTAVIVRRYSDSPGVWLRRWLHGLFQMLPRLNVEEQLELRETMSDGARPGVNYFVLIVLSSLIATLGLLLDSAAVVIGAMLVAPLMSPILAFSLGLVLGDVRLIRLSVEAVFKGVALAMIIAIFVGIFSPLRDMTAEIMARTQPTLFDLTIALASGLAGAYALARKEVSAALPGVAIAAALMPPLTVVGLGLSLGNPQVAGGAFLLFLANIAAISLAGVIVFILLGIRAQTWQPEARQQLWRRLIGFAVLLLVIAIPLGVIMSSIVRRAATQQEIQEVLTAEVTAQGRELVDVEQRAEAEELVVVATVRSVAPIEQAKVDVMASILQERLERPVTLEVITLPVTRSSP